jgi:hypothetical protein
MKMVRFNLLLFSLLLFNIFNPYTQADTLKTKGFQLIVKYIDNSIDTFMINKIDNYSGKNILKNAYGIIVDENFETGPKILYTLNGQFDFIEKHGNKMCFEFQINYASGDKYSLIKSSLLSCTEQTEQIRLPGYYYYIKGNMQDVFKYKLPLLFIIDEQRGLTVYLKIKE